MKYYDITSRKRPVWKEFINKYNTAMLCDCGEIVQTRQGIYEHWQQGHFDVYDEYQDKNKKTTTYKLVEDRFKEVKRSIDCCGCPSFPYSLCPACARENT